MSRASPRRRTRLSPFLSFLLFHVYLAVGACAPPEAAPAGGEPPPAPATLGSAELGRGFIVWESNREGPWRLFRRELDGSGLRRLTPDEEGRDHCCPHVSPDGSSLVYLSFVPGQRSKGRPIRRGELRRMPAEGGPAEVLDADVRVPSEQRAAVWRSPEELLYISGDGHTRLLNPATGDGRLLTRRPHPSDGWLMNPPLTHATTGWPTFSPYDAATGAIAERKVFGGCQPYFSHDGVWGFWAAGAGGPLRRIDLATRSVGTILEKGDTRLPRDRGYLYFPMLSPDGTLFAWGASAGEHDFNRADYDLFVAEVDAATLELVGEPVRLTANPATDRFPEVFRRPLLLGRHRGEAPLPVTFRLPPEIPEPLEIDFGDGKAAAATPGGSVEHVYTAPGLYEVGAGPSLRGRVRVETPRPPQPVGVEIRGERTLVVGFDEPIRDDGTGSTGIRATLASGGKVLAASVGEEGRTLRLELEGPISGPDELRLSGVRDRAARPNVMEPAVLAVEPPTWPSDRRGLVFLWQHGNAPNLVPAPPGGGSAAARTYALRPRGAARLDHFWTLQPAGGIFAAEEEAGEAVTAGLRRTNRMTLELTVRTDPRGGRVELLRLGPPQRPYLRLTLDGVRVLLDLRLGEPYRRELFTADLGRPFHVALSYEPGRLQAYRDGEAVLDAEDLQGDFFAWKRPGALTLGAPPEGAPATPPWDGRLEGLALYDRVLSAQEVAENHRRYRAGMKHRPSPPGNVVEAVLTARSEIPTLDQIAPYRQGLVVFEYRLGKVLSGEAPGATFRVAHWALLDGEPRPATRRTLGETFELTLEPFAANPQLEALFVSDTLPPGSSPLWFDAAP